MGAGRRPKAWWRHLWQKRLSGHRPALTPESEGCEKAGTQQGSPGGPRRSSSSSSISSSEEGQRQLGNMALLWESRGLCPPGLTHTHRWPPGAHRPFTSVWETAEKEACSDLQVLPSFLSPSLLPSSFLLSLPSPPPRRGHWERRPSQREGKTPENQCWLRNSSLGT